ncbi:MAG: (2Fe-2S)-binding protein [Synergistetes bacterium]|nr:(2Fe-2S)-binding protein [Synergistota bacterium]
MVSEVCPACGKQGLAVKNFTVKHIVKEQYLNDVGDGDYFLCMNPECDVGYYGRGKVFSKNQLKVPIWLKRDANPKYVCYCSKVTEEDVINAVLEKGANTIADVCKITGAMSNCKCEINNPTGSCCYNIVKEAFERALVLKRNRV